MKKMNENELTARISRFMDRKLAKTIDSNDLGSHKKRRSHRQLTEVTASPYIALAIK